MRVRRLKTSKEIRESIIEKRREEKELGIKPPKPKKKLKPRGRPFEKGNTLGRANGKKALQMPVKLNEFKNAIKAIAEEGKSVTEACEGAGLSVTHFYNIKNSDAELTKVYYEALKRRADLDIERVRHDVLTCDKDTAFPAKMKIDFIKWITAKLNPERYGDVDSRPPVNLEIKIGSELVQVKGANKR